MAGYLDASGLKHFKRKNDATYLGKQDESKFSTELKSSRFGGMPPSPIGREFHAPQPSS
jgi:hypothetical protein